MVPKNFNYTARLLDNPAPFVGHFVARVLVYGKKQHNYVRAPLRQARLVQST